VNIAPTPQHEKGRYAFVFPLRPGQTEFQVSYHIAYGGKATIDPHLIYPLQHFVAIMPRSIAFTPSQSGVYQDKQPPDQPDAIAEVAGNPQPGQKLAFEISGDGMLQDQTQNASNGAAGAATPSTDTRPGGGLGEPIEAPDPLDMSPLSGQGPMVSYRTITLLGLGAIYTAQRSRSSFPASVPPGAAATPSSRSTLLLDALKEELFQLEMEHKQGQISDQEYAKAKAALDETLARAIKRNR
jgi:hypothetical protein